MVAAGWWGQARHWAFRNLEPTAWPRTGLSPVNRAVCLLICLATLGAVLETEPTLHPAWTGWFAAADRAFTLVFAIEYLARIWAAAENRALGGSWRARLRYAVTPAALFDLLALAPALLLLTGSETLLLRFVRLIRILRLARLGRFSTAMRHLSDALRSRRFELTVSAAAALLLLLVSATLLYLVEGAVQPDAFGSIPRAMWWSIATLTTVGYGDVYPATALGRILAGITAIAGIGLIAMPTGILAAAFSDAVQRSRQGTSGSS